MEKEAFSVSGVREIQIDIDSSEFSFLYAARLIVQLFCSPFESPLTSHIPYLFT